MTTDGPSDDVLYSPAGFAFALRVSQVRSFFRVGLAVSEAFPTEEAWTAYMNEADTIETMNAVAEIMSLTVTELGDTPEDSLDKYKGLAVEALEPFGERIGADPDDLLVIIVS